ncbi:MAG TPA: gamma-butyrobetaine hydroxylase-like domain-containing protein [Methylomirabilota bacterium]|nr:gamma-butyrobetaine hydroxylase-like domain-containing protein [Methylomirabilota bacterium]
MTPIKLSLPIVGQPNPSEPKDVHLVGRYAVGVTWADDHSSIYPFDRLRLDDPARRGEPDIVLTEAMRWPRDIKKLPEGLRVTWSDDHQSLYPYSELRALCRCAGCTGGH